MQTTSVPGYEPSDYPPFAVTVDVVLFTIRDGALHVLLVQRGGEPFQGAWALPGGFVLSDEDLDHAAARELAEETGLRDEEFHLEQLASYGDPGRDPRMRVVTVAYWAVCANLPEARAGGDATAADLVDVQRVEGGEVSLAFDHHRILSDARERLRAKMSYSAIGARFLPSAFRVRDLRRVYEVVWSTTLDAGNFQRNFMASGAFRRLRRPSHPARTERGRPASLWSLKDTEARSATALNRPIARHPLADRQHANRTREDGE